MRDFTSGSIPGHLVAFAWPMFLGNLLQALYNTVDSIWVGRFLGPDALGAVSVSFPIIFALISLVMGITMAITTLVAQYAGARDMAMVRKTVGNSVTLLTVLGFVSALAGFVFRVPLLRLINTPEGILELAADYLGIFMVGLVGMFLYNVVGAILRGLGDSKTPLIFLVYATVINIVLDPVLIFGIGPVPRLGVAGAALATGLAQTVSAVMALMHLYRNTEILTLDRGLLRLDRQLTKVTFGIGLPAGIQQTVVSFSMMAVNAIINTFGPVVVAAYGAAARLDQFAFLPAMSVSLAVTALVGQNLGAGEENRVKDIIRWSALLTVGITLAVTLAAVTWPGLLLSMFTTDAAVLDHGIRYLRIVGFSYVPFSLMFMMIGVLRGAGDTMATMVITIFTLWLFRVPMAGYLSHLPSLGEAGIWLAIAISPLLGVSCSYIYYLTGRWKSKVITRQRLSEA